MHQSSGGGSAILRVILRTLLIIISTVLLFAVFLVGVLGVVFRGPSTEARRLLVLSANETSALKFVPGLFLPEETVESILHPAPAVEEQEPEVVDTFVELRFEEGTAAAQAEADQAQAGQTVVVADPAGNTEGDWFELTDIKGATFKGKLMIIKDPAKVLVGTLDAYGGGYHGLYLYEFLEKYNAIGGTNAGGFYDPNGGGNGGTPDGLVMRDGAIAYGSTGVLYNNVIGFDADHILHVGNMTGQEAVDLGLVSAVSFSPGPVLVQDGVLQTGLGGGMNPRTCIGQCADGTILLMVIEGRKPDSLGATYDDIAKILYDRGAVNAANLDGGSSSLMYYNGEQVTRGSNLIGMRQMSTAILVLS